MLTDATAHGLCRYFPAFCALGLLAVMSPRAASQGDRSNGLTIAPPSLPASASGTNKVPDKLASQAPSEAGAEDYVFTNELGRRINLADFSGQALAITFIFTRCPIPQYCPRLSKNFAEAAERLTSNKALPTNWHFFSVTIDPEFDTPPVLKAYAERYKYDGEHWSFLTGPKDRIQRFGNLFGLAFDPDGNLLKHSFRTVIVDRTNNVQQIIPVSGNFSDDLVQEMLKALGGKMEKRP